MPFSLKGTVFENMEITHLFFDADNTLIDFNKASKLSLKSLFTNYGISYTESYINIYKEINLKCWKSFERGEIDKNELIFQRFNQFFLKIGLNEDPIIANTEYLRLLVEHSHLIPGALELLKILRSKYKLHIITNGFKEVQRPKFTRLGLDTYFDNIIVSDEIGMKKPEIRFFDYSLQKAGSPNRNRVMVIGDSLSSDIKGAIQSRLQSIWYNPHKIEKDETIQPSYIVNNLRQILNIL